MAKMSKLDYAAKQVLIKKLKDQGYVTYANFFSNFIFNLTYKDTYSDSDPIAYTDMKQRLIVLNGNLDMDAASTVLRHELLHNILEHMTRESNYWKKELGFNAAELTPEQLKEYSRQLYSHHQTANKAMDWELSNYYTEADKKIAKNLNILGELVSGLVVDVDHPEWKGWTFEDMFRELIKEQKAQQEQAKQELSQMDKQQLSDLIQQAADAAGLDSSEILDELDLSDSQSGDSQQNSQQAGDNDSQQSDENSQQDSNSGSQADKNQKGKSSQQGGNGGSDQNSDSNGQESDQSGKGEQKSDKSDSKNQQGSNDESVFGRFVDEHTFIADDGTVYHV